MSMVEIIISIIIVYILHNAISKYKKIHFNELCGPTPIPILGNLHQFGDLPHRDLTKMTKKYGHIMRIYMADMYTVVVSDPLLIREMYVDNSDIFTDRIKKPSVEHGTFYHGTVTSSGEHWKNNREIVGKAMRKTNLKHIYELLDKQVDVLISSMKQIESSGKTFDTRYYITKFTMAAMFKFLFNHDIPQDEDINTGEIQRLMGPMSEVFQNAGRGSLFDVINVTQPLYLLWLELFDKSFKDIMKYHREKYNEHLKTFDPDVERDLLDILIKEYGTDNDDTILTILATINDFFLAGVDTSSTALESMILMLTNYPEIQEKAYDEIKTTLNGRTKVCLSDRQSTPYLVAVIKETLRYKPMSPFGLPRSSSRDCMIGGHFIPKNSQILINFQALGMNEEYYENPEQFDPSRFLKVESNVAFLPFSIGIRSCVGQSFAQDELYICISNILLNFKLNSIDGKKIDETESYGLTLKTKTRFNVSLEKRNI